nr:unnamed protein product [Digitaria exilis]
MNHNFRTEQRKINAEQNSFQQLEDLSSESGCGVVGVEAEGAAGPLRGDGEEGRCRASSVQGCGRSPAWDPFSLRPPHSPRGSCGGRKQRVDLSEASRERAPLGRGPC